MKRIAIFCIIVLLLLIFPGCRLDKTFPIEGSWRLVTVENHTTSQTLNFPMDAFNSMTGATDSDSNGYKEYDADGDGTNEELYISAYSRVTKDKFDYYYKLQGNDGGTASIFDSSSDPLGLVANNITGFGTYRSQVKSGSVEEITDKSLTAIDQENRVEMTYTIYDDTAYIELKKYDSSNTLVEESSVTLIRATKEEEQDMDNAQDCIDLN